MFSRADQAEQIRSNQKDELYITQLRANINSLAQSMLGAPLWIKWRRELDVLADLGYFGLTTLAGFQTLGEEYVSLVQVDSTLRAVPSSLRRFLLVVCHVFTPYLLHRLLKYTQHQLQSNVHLPISPGTRSQLLGILPALHHAITLIHRCHLAAFYLRGTFYHVAKRTAGVHYILGRGIKPNSSGGRGYRLLGWLAIIQLSITFLSHAHQWYRTNHIEEKGLVTPMHMQESDATENTSEVMSSSERCPLCLERRRNPTAPPCGHVFCWDCIMEWTSNKPECPLCREESTPNRLVYLRNFDAS